MPADLTLVNLNLLFMRYGEQIERERHVPLGCLYLTAALERAGFTVDFRDYQLCESSDPFELETFLAFVADPAPVIGLSCMANLLPFTLLAAQALKDRYPDRKIVLGGVGSKAVEDAGAAPLSLGGRGRARGRRGHRPRTDAGAGRGRPGGGPGHQLPEEWFGSAQSGPAPHQGTRRHRPARLPEG